MTETLADQKFEWGSKNIELWEQHCREAGHTMASEGGTAHYDMTLSCRYIQCCEKGCKWEHEFPR